MNFLTQFNRTSKPPANSGSPIHVLLSPAIDDKGILHLKETGTENLYDYIQSHRDSVDIHKILQRFEEGDTSALPKVQGQFGDFSDYPRSYAELLNKVLEGEQSFNQLPLDVREQFGFSYERWLASAGSDSWLSAMGLSPTPDTPPDPPVVTLEPSGD